MNDELLPISMDIKHEKGHFVTSTHMVFNLSPSALFVMQYYPAPSADLIEKLEAQQLLNKLFGTK